MPSQRHYIFSVLFLLLASLAQAQMIPSAKGTSMTIAAVGEVTQTNNQAVMSFLAEVEDQNEAVAASKVNQKMKEATALIKQLDPNAKLETAGYYTYPIYPNLESHPHTKHQTLRPIRWRITQSLQITTTSLATLSKTVAAAQGIVSLTGIHFGLSEQARKQSDQEKLAMAYRHLTQRIAAIAQAINVDQNRATIDTIDFATNDDDSGHMPRMMRMSAPIAADTMQKNNSVIEPSFEPGETTVKIRIIATVVFK
jgi:uncharacterized protein YggE